MDKEINYVMPDLEVGMIMSYKELAITTSDERLKKNIEDCDKNALETINKIRHIKYDWDKEKSGKEGHINIGYGAREIMKLDSNFVIKNLYKKDNEIKEVYTINVLNVLSTATKAIQELSEENSKLQEEIDILKEEQERINNLVSLEGVHTHTHTHKLNLIEKIRVAKTTLKVLKKKIGIY